MQAHAILKYLARKFNLTAKTDPELALEEMLEFQLDDFINRIVQTGYFKTYNSDSEFETELTSLRADVKSHLALLEKHLGEKTWFTGSKFSYIDILAFENIDQCREIVDKDCLAPFPKLTSFMVRFAQLEQLKEYLASDQFTKYAIFSPTAKIGGKKR